MALRCSAPASNSSVKAPLPAASSRWRSATAPRPATTLSRRPRQQQLPDGAPLRRPGQQQLPDGSSPQRLCQQQLCHGAPASNNFPMALRHGAPASNKPHPAEKSTPVWLAIWRTWAGFANSQLRLATLRCIFIYICAHPHCFHLGAAAQTDANLSAHLHRLPTPPPYLRQMRLLHGCGAGIRCWMRRLPGKGRRCWVQDEAAV